MCQFITELLLPAFPHIMHQNMFLFSCFFSDVPIHYRITPTSISTCHALKYFLVLMFFSDMPIHRQITPATVSTYHASKHFQFVMLFSYVPIYCQSTAFKTSTELCCPCSPWFTWIVLCKFLRFCHINLLKGIQIFSLIPLCLS